MSDTQVAGALSVREAASELGVSIWSVYRYARSGDLPAVRLGSKILIPRHQLDRLLNGQPASEPSALEEALTR